MDGLDFASIVAGAYDAALNDSLWTSWATNLFLTLGGSGGLFGLHDTREKSLTRIISMDAPGRAIDEYNSGYFQFDPQIPHVSALLPPCAYIGMPNTDVTQKDIADYLRWQQDVAQMYDSQTAVFSLGDASYRASICVHKKREFGAVTREQHRALKRLLPKLEHAFQLAFRHTEMLAMSFWDGILVGREGEMAFLLDERGCVMRHTDAADALVQQRDGIDILVGKLSAARADETAALQAIIARAVNRMEPVSGSMRLRRPSGKRSLIVICYPLPRHSKVIGPFEAAALLTIVDPHSFRQCPAGLYRQALGLTLREAEIAWALMKGHSVETTAALFGISIPTTRIHLRRLFEKSGTNSQAGLIRLLSQIS